MKGQWHINREGIAGRCDAETDDGCPFTDVEGGGHFNDFASALDASMEFLDNKYGAKKHNKMSKKTKDTTPKEPAPAPETSHGGRFPAQTGTGVENLDESQMNWLDDQMAAIRRDVPLEESVDELYVNTTADAYGQSREFKATNNFDIAAEWRYLQDPQKSGGFQRIESKMTIPTEEEFREEARKYGLHEMFQDEYVTAAGMLYKDAKLGPNGKILKIKGRHDKDDFEMMEQNLGDIRENMLGWQREIMSDWVSSAPKPDPRFKDEKVRKNLDSEYAKAEKAMKDYATAASTPEAQKLSTDTVKSFETVNKKNYPQTNAQKDQLIVAADFISRKNPSDIREVQQHMKTVGTALLKANKGYSELDQKTRDQLADGDLSGLEI